MSRLTEAVKAFKADPALVNYGPGVSPGPSLLAQPTMPYEVENPEIAKTLKWAWVQLEKVIGAQAANGYIELVALALKHGEVKEALRTLAVACCDEELIPDGSSDHPVIDFEVRNLPIAALQPVLNQLNKLEAVWTAALKVAA